MKKQIKTEYKAEVLIDRADAFDCVQYVTNGYYMHFHTSLEIYGVKKAKSGVKCRVGNKQIVLNEGQFIVVNPLTLHSYVTESGAEIIFIQIGKRYLSDFITLYPNMQFNEFLDDVDYNKRIFDKMTHVARNLNVLTELEKIAMTDMILSDIVERYGLSPADEGMGGGNSENSIELVAKILNYITKNYAEKINLQLLAEEFSVSPMVLSRFISKSLKQDLRVIVNNVRAQAFYIKRKDPAYAGVSNINLAYMCGFQNQQTFNAAYARNFHDRPSE